MGKWARWLRVGAVCVFLGAACSDQVIAIQGGECPAGSKRCEIHETPGAFGCVSKSDWKYGCGSPSCVPCAGAQVETFLCKPDGTCGAGTCFTNYADCDQMFGCETPLATDPNNCGMCGTTCSEMGQKPNVATVKCGGSMCLVGTCVAGTFDCDGAFGNGCEVPSATNPFTEAKCGSCRPCGIGTICDTGSWTCKPTTTDGGP